jgi:hypothetical protein
MQFSGQVRGALTLRKSLQNSDDLSARSLRALPDGASKGIVDSSATTMVVQHRSAITPMDAAFRCRPSATITAQALRMQVIDQPVVAFLFVQQIGDRKRKHDPVSRYPSGYRQTGLQSSHR